MKTLLGTDGRRQRVAAALIFLLAVSAQADVKIVSHLHGMAMGRALPEQTQTTYYRGDKMRVDQFGSVVILYDAKAGKVDILKTSDKTYTESNANDMPAFFESMKVEANATVTPTSEHKTIAGLNATKYTISVHVSITKPGGAPEPTDMAVDVWTTPDLKSPFQPVHLVRSLGQFVRGISFTGMPEIAAELNKVKGFPIEQTITLSTIPGMSGMQSNGSGPMVTVISTPDSVSEAPLGDDLFAIPADYKKVDRFNPGGP